LSMHLPTTEQALPRPGASEQLGRQSVAAARCGASPGISRMFHFCNKLLEFFQCFECELNVSFDQSMARYFPLHDAFPDFPSAASS